MKKIVAFVAGDPDSINSEIIAKTWKKRNISKNLNMFIIGNYNLIRKQFKILKIKINIKKLESFRKNDFKKSMLVYNVPFKFKNAFKNTANGKRKYILNSLNLGIKLVKEKKIVGFINCPINKREVFGNTNLGVTEYLAKKFKVTGKEAMLIYNKNLSVSPLTTHIQIKKIAGSITKKNIENKIITINNFFYKTLKIKPKIGVLGLNPHNYELRNNSEEKKIIIPVIKKVRNKGIKITGPIPADTAFLKNNRKKFNVILGMYHDQVLSPFKALYNFDAINITLGIPYLRISPDHGTGQDIIKKNIANPESLIESIKFFKKVNVKS